MTAPSTFRAARLKLALLTSLAGKGIATVVQLIAIPFAVTALGPERFGVYAMLAAILNWISLASVSVVPGLTVELVKSSAARDRSAEALVFRTSLLLAGALCLLLFAVLEIGSSFIDLRAVFGETYVRSSAELEHGLAVLAPLAALNVLLSVADGARAGYQSQHVHNLYLAGANAVTIVAIALLVWRQPSVSHMILAVFAPPIAARLASLIHLVTTHRYLVTDRFRFVWRGFREIAITGLPFAVTSIATFLYQSYTIYAVGHRLGAVAAAQMAVIAIVLNVSGSVLTMVTQPLWPAIHDATVRGDLRWVKQAYLRTRRHLVIYFGCAAIVLAGFGAQVLGYWLPVTPESKLPWQVFLGAYFFLVAWEHLNYSFLIGNGRYWHAALPFFGGSLVMLIASQPLLVNFGIGGMLLAMCLGPASATSWIYPRLLSRAVRPSARGAH